MADVAYYKGQAIAIAQNILDGRIDMLEGAILLADFRFRQALSNSMIPDEDFNLFDLIADEVESLPMSSEKHLWDAAVLAQKEAELHSIKAFYFDAIRNACLSLLQRFK